jgi:hypothetical protein
MRILSKLFAVSEYRHDAQAAPNAPLARLHSFPYSHRLLIAPSAQAQSARVVHVTVTDPLNRFVTGLEQEGFQIVEKGVRRPITGFSDAKSPITVAIVSESPLPVNSPDRLADELIQTASVSDALRQLQASKTSGKALVITNAADTRAIPGKIQVVQTDPDNLSKRVVELSNRYLLHLLQFQSSDADASVEVILQQPQGLPQLRTNLM